MSLYRDIRNILSKELDSGEASAICFMLLEEVAGMNRAQALIGDDVDSELTERLMAMARRIASGEPVQYVIGRAYFCGLPFTVAPGVLIPRPETEELVDWVVRTNDAQTNDCRILDIGTGSGCIAVSLAHQLKEAKVEAWDISDDALRIAKENAKKNGVGVRFNKVDVLQVSSAGLDKDKFSIIVSNPPYICHKEVADMCDNVLSHEPHLALFVPDDDPLLFYRKIAELGLHLLAPNGHLFYEVNRAFGKETVGLLTSLGYKDIELRQDQFGNDRMVHAIKA